MEAGIAALEQQTGKKFGDLKNPLLVSVRSGARDSMPGMMDTILNLGLNDQTVEALARKTGNPRFAWDCYRRFIQMYGDVVLGVQKRPDEDHEPFEMVIDALKHERYHQDIEDTKLTVDDLKELVARFKALVKERVGKQFPGLALGPAPGRGRRGLRLLDERSRHRLSAQVQHSHRVGHRRQRAGDGLWQHGRPVRIRRGLHARSRPMARRSSTANS